MEYEFDNKHGNIMIDYCTPEEVKLWLESLEKVIPNSPPLSEIENKLNNIKNIDSLEQFNFNRFERVYFNRDSIMYVLNVNLGARSTYFSILKEHFNAAKRLVENN